MDELVRYLKALVLLQLHSAQTAAEGSGASYQPEIILAAANFSHKEIADMIGKTPGAVAKAVSRAKAKRGRAAENAEAETEGADSE